MDNRSKLVRIRLVNLGCYDGSGLEIALDDIVCLVGVNNTGKSTVLRAYEAAVTMSELRPDELCSKSPGLLGEVELWVHIPRGVENIDEKWKEEVGGLLLVRSRWQWPALGGKPTRTTWDPQTKDYAADGKAAGLDQVFNSRLPRPFRIGSLEDPSAEHKKLLELVLEPIKERLSDLITDEASDLCAKIRLLKDAAEKPVAEFREELDKVQTGVNKSYKNVFSNAEVRLHVSLSELTLDPSGALLRSSRIEVLESHGPTRWHQQGTGSQRALFWSMLEVRSELNRLREQKKARDKALKDLEKELKKKEVELAKAKTEAKIVKTKEEIAALLRDIKTSSPDSTSVADAPPPFLPGYMLLIDEPETALHPNAIRAAKDHLYSLASESGWQVMLSTHHPAFVDPLKDHTTIVRLHRPELHLTPNIYRTDEIAFTGDEKQNLKSLLAFDASIAEMFFSTCSIIMEGDTEFAAFDEVMSAHPDDFPIDNRPHLIRARGKYTIPILIKILAHFRVNFAVLHDIDAPKTTKGEKKNGAYTANAHIKLAIAEARKQGVHVIHRCSCPCFEQQHGMDLPAKDKPFAAWNAVRSNDIVKASVRKVLDDLYQSPGPDSGDHEHDGQHYEACLKKWVATNAHDPAYVFDEEQAAASP